MEKVRLTFEVEHSTYAIPGSKKRSHVARLGLLETAHHTSRQAALQALQAALVWLASAGPPYTHRTAQGEVWVLHPVGQGWEFYNAHRRRRSQAGWCAYTLDRDYSRQQAIDALHAHIRAYG